VILASASSDCTVRTLRPIPPCLNLWRGQSEGRGGGSSSITTADVRSTLDAIRKHLCSLKARLVSKVIQSVSSSTHTRNGFSRSISPVQDKHAMLHPRTSPKHVKVALGAHKACFLASFPCPRDAPAAAEPSMPAVVACASCCRARADRKVLAIHGTQ